MLHADFSPHMVRVVSEDWGDGYIIYFFPLSLHNVKIFHSLMSLCVRLPPSCIPGHLYLSSGSLSFCVNCGFLLSPPLRNAGFTSHLHNNPPCESNSCSLLTLTTQSWGCWNFLFPFLFFFFFLNSCLLIKDCQSLGRIPDVPTVMSMLVQYLRKLDVKINHVIPAEGVPVD